MKQNDTIAYTPDLKQQKKDTQALQAGLSQVPEISDEQFAEYEQYVGLFSEPVKAVKKAIDYVIPKAKDEKPFVSTVEPREKTGASKVETAKEQQERTRREEALNVEDEASSMLDYKYVSYDKNDKPEHMPRMDAGATYRLDSIETDEDVDSVVQYMADKYKDKINNARRNVLGDAEANKFANEIGVSKERMKELLSRPDGTTASVEEVFAMRKLMEQSARKLKVLAEKTRGGDAKAEDKASFEQAFLFHRDLMSKFMGYRAEAGRSLRAYGVNMSRFADAETQQNMLDLAMSGYDTKKIANIIATSGDVKGINDATQKLGWWRRATETGMTNFVNSILSGVSTQVVNTVSGAMQLNFSYMDRLIAEGGTRIRMAMGRDVTDLVQVGEAGALRVGMFTSARQAIKTASHSFKTAQAYGGIGKFQDYQNPLSAEYWGLAPDSIMGNMIDTYGNLTGFMVRNVMGGTDAYFKVVSEQGQYTALAYRNAVSDVMQLDIPKEEMAMELEKRIKDYLMHPTTSMIQEAKLHAERVTYQDYGETANAITNLIKIQPWLKAFIPFVNTPTSIFQQNLVNRTPLAVFRPSLYQNTAEGQIARSQALSGVVMMYLASELVDGGFITGSEPLTWEGKMRWESEGRKAHSIAIPKTGGGYTYVNYGRMENIAYALQMVSDFKQLYHKKEIDWEMNEDAEEMAKLKETIELMAIVSMKSMEDKTFIAGFDKLLDVVSGGASIEAGERKIEDAIFGFIAGSVPLSGMQRDVKAWFIDDEKKDTKALLDKIQANIIFLGKNLKPRLDYLGRPLHIEQRGNPFTVTGADKDPLFREADRIYKETSIEIMKPLPRVIEGVRLTSEQYHNMVKYVRAEKQDGVTYHEYMMSIISDESYKELGDNAKADMLRNASNRWDNGIQKLYVHTQDPELYEKVINARTVKLKKKGRIE